METSEQSKNANGGTEISKSLLENNVNKELSQHFQVIPSRVRELDENKIRIYSVHDLSNDPECSHLADATSRNRFHKIIFQSDQQLQDFVTKLKIPLDEKLDVIETPIVPFPSISKVFGEKINLVYFSTPQRGLNIVVPVVAKLAETYPNIHLDVFSSFAIYGWPDADKQFEPLYEQIRNHPNMTYHGYTSPEILRTYLNKAHILAYSCVWPETSCRTLIESMSAGLLCVHSNLGALPDTSGHLTSMYQYQDDVNIHARIFFQYLNHAIDNVAKPEIQNYLKFIKTYADLRFSIDKVSKKWEMIMNDLLLKYPTIESRKLPSPNIIFYDTNKV